MRGSRFSAEYHIIGKIVYPSLKNNRVNFLRALGSNAIVSYRIKLQQKGDGAGEVGRRPKENWASAA